MGRAGQVGEGVALAWSRRQPDMAKKESNRRDTARALHLLLPNHYLTTHFLLHLLQLGSVLQVSSRLLLRTGTISLIDILKIGKILTI